MGMLQFHVRQLHIREYDKRYDTMIVLFELHLESATIAASRNRRRPREFSIEGSDHNFTNYNFRKEALYIYIYIYIYIHTHTYTYVYVYIYIYIYIYMYTCIIYIYIYTHIL